MDIDIPKIGDVVHLVSEGIHPDFVPDIDRYFIVRTIFTKNGQMYLSDKENSNTGYYYPQDFRPIRKGEKIIL